MPRRISVEIVGDSRSVERAFGRAGRAGKGFSRDVGGTARSIGRNVAIIGAAAAGVGIVTGKAFSSFEQSLDRVVGLAGGARESVSKMGEQILQLAPEVAKSPAELADTLYFVASAGVAASEQMDVVTLSAKAAASGLGETSAVADAVTSAMNAYGSSVVDAAKATDVLVNTVKFGKGEAASFAPVIGTVAAIAAELGVKFEEVGAALAAQTRLGISAETAAIQLQATFSSLLKTTPKAEKALAGVGLSSKGLRQQLKEKGLLSVLETLKQSFAGNTSEMAKAFPNIRALRGLLVLVGKNAASTRQVFEGMKDSTGALGTAFNAVSKDEAFRFQQTLAALRVTGIRLGGLLAPVARTLAAGASRALGVVNDFLSKLGKARTIRAKLDVVWEGVERAAEGVTAAIGDAVAKIDWNQVWGEARGIADGLQKRLEQVDWGFVGTQIGNAFADAVRVAVPATKELAARIHDAIQAVDWESLGRGIGPGLAAAIASAFVTLTDPAFWLRNWDLALAIGLTAFGGSIGKFAGSAAKVLAGKFGIELVGIGGRLSGSLVRLANRAGLALVGAVGRISERASVALFEGLARLGPLVGRALAGIGRFVLLALSPLTGLVRRVFARLGRVGRFVVKVLGIQAAINAVVGFGRKVGNAFKGIGVAIKNAFSRAFDWLKRRALKDAILIIEPFTHIPGFLGGGTFRDLQSKWQATLDSMGTAADAEATSINRSLSGIEDPTVTITFETRSPEGRTSRGNTAAGGRAGGGTSAAADAAASAAAAAAAAEEDAANRAAAARKAAAAAAKKAAAQAKKAKEQATTAFENLMDSLALDLRRKEVTPKLEDDIRVLLRTQRAIQDRIKAVGRTTELEGQLFDVQQALIEKRRAARSARQFRALGLTAEGDTPVPTAKQLRRQLGSINKAIEGTFLDTKKTGSLLARIRRVLSGALGKLGADVRAKIKEILDDLHSQLSGDAKDSGPKTKFQKANLAKITAGIGLSADQIKELKERVARIGRGGTTPGSGQSAFGYALPRGGAPGGGSTTTGRRGAPRVSGSGTRSGFEHGRGRGAAVRVGTSPVAAGPGKVSSATFNIYGDIQVRTNDVGGFVKQVQKQAARSSSSRRGTRPGRNRGMG
jgi:TP901 family phage tail tape measure protein